MYINKIYSVIYFINFVNEPVIKHTITLLLQLNSKKFINNSAIVEI